MIDESPKLIKSLKDDAKSVFGIMSPQHMVEHLIWSLRISNGESKSELMFRQEKAEKMKAALIYTDAEMPIGFRAPVLPKDDVLPLVYADLEEAKSVFTEELNRFHDYFRINPKAKPTNPSLGDLDYQEWQIFHTKHFSHHFKQFSLV